MVLHLLGKKSWNVYNGANIERVRRDEAEARAREEAEEQRMQEEDAKRRMAILRGEQPPPLQESAGTSERRAQHAHRRDDGVPRKRRRLRGEDDTDRDIRYAREDAEAGETLKQALLLKRDGQDAPLLDHAGHLQLIPAPDVTAIRDGTKAAEIQARKTEKQRREEDSYTMRFSNAAGSKNGMEKPWYAASKPGATAETSDVTVMLASVQDKDVWGNEDPLRKKREHSRISSSDPFAVMQQAQRQLKRSERDREQWQRKRDKEVEEFKQMEERKRKRHKRRDTDVDSLENFSLDTKAREDDRQSKRDRRHHHHHHRHRSRNRSRE